MSKRHGSSTGRKVRTQLPPGMFVPKGSISKYACLPKPRIRDSRKAATK